MGCDAALQIDVASVDAWCGERDCQADSHSNTFDLPNGTRLLVRVRREGQVIVYVYAEGETVPLAIVTGARLTPPNHGSG